MRYQKNDKILFNSSIYTTEIDTHKKNTHGNFKFKTRQIKHSENKSDDELQICVGSWFKGAYRKLTIGLFLQSVKKDSSVKLNYETFIKILHCDQLHLI